MKYSFIRKSMVALVVTFCSANIALADVIVNNNLSNHRSIRARIINERCGSFFNYYNVCAVKKIKLNDSTNFVNVMPNSQLEILTGPRIFLTHQACIPVKDGNNITVDENLIAKFPGRCNS